MSRATAALSSSSGGAAGGVASRTRVGGDAPSAPPPSTSFHAEEDLGVVGCSSRGPGGGGGGTCRSLSVLALSLGSIMGCTRFRCARALGQPVLARAASSGASRQLSQVITCCAAVHGAQSAGGMLASTFMPLSVHCRGFAPIIRRIRALRLNRPCPAILLDLSGPRW